MLSRTIRHILLVDSLGALPGFAAAQGSQAGDSGRQPVGADNDSPRQAIPTATSNDRTPYRYDRRAYREDRDDRNDRPTSEKQRARARSLQS